MFVQVVYQGLGIRPQEWRIHLGGVNHKQGILTYYVVYPTKFQTIPENIFKLVGYHIFQKAVIKII